MNFGHIYVLNRAERYTNPLDSNAALPVVFGDLTDGADGNWKLPCIDTVNFVYCFAGHAVLSVVNGNSINIYADDALVNPANYTFDESDDYEGQGTIAKVTFAGDQGNSVITARGKGKDDAGTLIENIVDIVDEFLTAENDFSSGDYEATAKATATALFSSQGYKAAGVIDRDVNTWELLQRMMASFLGSIYFNAQKQLVLSIDDGVTIHNPAAFISKANIELVEARQRLASLTNQCPARYAYNYAKGQFRSYDDGSSYANNGSQGIYGVQAPEPYEYHWCRHLTSIQTMQEIITTKYGKPVWEIEFKDSSAKSVHCDAGDVVAATFDMLYDADGIQKINEFIEILSVKPDLDRDRMILRGIDTNLFMTIAYLADGTYLADGSIKAGGNRDLTIY